jgi:hypothetical protein
MYSEKEIDDLIAELRVELPEILKKGGEELSKAFTPGPGKMMKESEKEESSSSSSEKSVMAKEATEDKSKPDMADKSPVSAEASDEKPPMPAPEAAAPEAPPVEDKAPEAPAAPEEPAPEATLEQAYSQLSDEDFQAHWEALKCVAMQRYGQPEAPAAPGMAPPVAPPAPPAAPPAPPQMAPKAPAMAMKSEANYGETLSKAEEKINGLEKQLESVTLLLEKMLNKPVQRAITSVAAIAKSESEKSQEVPLTRDQIKSKLAKKARSVNLTKSDRDLIDRYVLNGDVKVSDLTHLLKD